MATTIQGSLDAVILGINSELKKMFIRDCERLAQDVDLDWEKGLKSANCTSHQTYKLVLEME